MGAETLPVEVIKETELPVIYFDFENSLEKSKPEIRKMISELEEILKTAPQIDLPVNHHFSPGVYARELPIPQGTVIIGKIHKFQTMNILSKGEVSVFSVDGVMRFKAPHTFVSSPGAKRVIYAHEDSVWTNIHATEETDPEKIEEQFIAKTYDDVPELAGREILEIKE